MNKIYDLNGTIDFYAEVEASSEEEAKMEFRKRMWDAIDEVHGERTDDAIDIEVVDVREVVR